jgi:hypothetical protein
VLTDSHEIFLLHLKYFPLDDPSGNDLQQLPNDLHSAIATQANMKAFMACDFFGLTALCVKFVTVLSTLQGKIPKK